MEMKFVVPAISLLLLGLNLVTAQQAILDIRKYGTKNGADATKALTNAWKEACASPTKTTILIPKGQYSLAEVSLFGPCKAPIEIQLQGTLKASPDPKQFKNGAWVTFQYIDFLTIAGGGTFDGQGHIAWSLNDCGLNPHCSKIINIRFNFVTNTIVRDITSLDSKNFHITLLGGKNVTFDHMTVQASGEKGTNTDGIHVGRSDGVNIFDANIQTGDDCISLGDGSKNIRVERVNCGPGHGIAVGSLGRYKEEEDVFGIHVNNCTLTNTMFGLRIKSYPNSPKSNTASDIHFENIVMNNVGTPILIDQEYCPWNQCNKNAPSKVKISNVRFHNIRGTSSTPTVVKLACSSGFPCEHVEVGDIDLRYNGPQGPATTLCSNLSPIFSGRLNPPICVAPSQASN